MAAALALAALAWNVAPVQAAGRGDTVQLGATPLPRMGDPCAPAASGRATCAGLTGRPGHAAVTRSPAVTPTGLGPLDLRDAYGLASSATTGGVGQVVAVVSAYDDPDAASDLAAYRAQYGLPSCPAADGCFQKVDETGGTNYPPPEAGWSAVDAESLDAISAVCPECRLILVEASSSAISDLGAAENEAVALGAAFVDNDWLTPESSSDTAYDSEYFDHPGVAITAPSGNSGYGTVNYPAASQYVIAVGGTTLTADSSLARGWNETAWPYSGSGCSAYDPKPSWQTDTGCTGRTDDDLSADAGTPIAIYDTPTENGWGTGGGTAVSAAIIAAAYALAGAPASGTYPASYPYAHTSLLNDITSGSTGACAPTYLCTAGPGYDGPTGLGTPASAAALGAPAPAASLPGGPVTYDPVTGDQDLYAGGTNGTAFQDSWSPATNAWSGYQNLGGAVTARPSAVNDPLDNAQEVYVRGSTGIVYEKYQLPGGNWSGWNSMGGSVIQGSPSAVYDPLAHSLEVYETGSTGTVFEDYWNSKSWSGWKNMGGTLAGSPEAVYDPADADLQIWGTGTNGTVWMRSWAPGKGWSSWQNMGGDLSGTPTAVYDPLDGAMEVYGHGPGGTVYEKYQPAGGNWIGWNNLGGSVINGSPSAVYDPLGHSLEVYETGSTGTVFEDYWAPGKGWSGWKNMGATLASGPDAVYDPASGDLDVYGIEKTGVIYENSWNSKSWSGWKSLGGTLGIL